jgi:hypothetical protein
MKSNNIATRHLVLAAFTAGVAGLSGMAVAAPSKSGATILNPYTLASLPVLTPAVVTLAPAAVVVPAADVAMSGLAPSKPPILTPAPPLASPPPPPFGGGAPPAPTSPVP